MGKFNFFFKRHLNILIGFPPHLLTAATCLKRQKNKKEQELKLENKASDLTPILFSSCLSHLSPSMKRSERVLDIQWSPQVLRVSNPTTKCVHPQAIAI